MSFFSGIANALSGGVGSLLGGVVSGVGSLVGGLATNSANQDIAQGQEDFQAQQYATRYQTTVKDMEAAGLNPMLAYSQGPGSSPSGAAIALQNPAGPGFSAPISGALTASAQQANIEADTATKLAMLPKKQIGGDIYSKVHDVLNNILDRVSNSGASISSRDLAPPEDSFIPPGLSIGSSAAADADWLSQLEAAGAQPH